MLDGENNLEGEFEIEKIPSHTVEARSRYLVPAVDHLRGIKVDMTRYVLEVVGWVTCQFGKGSFST